MDEHQKLSKIYNQAKQANHKKYQESSRKRLMKNVEKKFQTTMIGALACFEEYFGQLWGNGKDDLDQEELYYYQLWQKARTELLNKGNSNLRAAMDEIAQYTMTWNRYTTNFIIKKDKK